MFRKLSLAVLVALASGGVGYFSREVNLNEIQTDVSDVFQSRVWSYVAEYYAHVTLQDAWWSYCIGMWVVTAVLFPLVYRTWQTKGDVEDPVGVTVWSVALAPLLPFAGVAIALMIFLCVGLEWYLTQYYNLFVQPKVAAPPAATASSEQSGAEQLSEPACTTVENPPASEGQLVLVEKSRLDATQVELETVKHRQQKLLDKIRDLRIVGERLGEDTYGHQRKCHVSQFLQLLEECVRI